MQAKDPKIYIQFFPLPPLCHRYKLKRILCLNNYIHYSSPNYIGINIYRRFLQLSRVYGG